MRLSESQEKALLGRNSGNVLAAATHVGYFEQIENMAERR
jgi:hypothetical protein